MGLHTNLLVTVLVLWLLLSELVTSCPQSCEGTNSDTQECPYEVKLKENSSSEMLMSCCDFNKILYSNRTFNKVTVLFPVDIKSCVLNMTYPFLNVEDIVIKDNNLTLIQINVNDQYVKTIDMSSNKLIVIEKGIFNTFKNIEELSLRKNNIETIAEESFKGLTKLESIDLSENKLKDLNTFLKPLKNLQKVNLSRNNIEIINENYFNNPMLQTLDISNNNLKMVVPGVLQLLPDLVQLIVSDNPNLCIAQPDTQLLVGSGRRLQQLDASRTGLHLVPEAFTHSVRFLSLDGNIITSVQRGDFDNYPLLQSLELSDNKISLIEDDSLGRLEMLLFLNINNNKLTAVPTSLTEELKYLSINNNLINNLTKTDFKNLFRLEVLFLQNNKISYIEERTFSDLVALKVLDLCYNPVKTLSTSTFDGPLFLRDLRLCYMNVTVPEKDCSFPMTSPESIHMLHFQSSPSLARQLLADSAVLAALPSLQYLDLRMNNLSEIRDDLPFHFWQLKTLRLHGNRFNCGDEHWLEDWLIWHGNVANSETCYYTTSAPIEEVEFKYNCSFSVTDIFTSVNLYSSDEMITELQKYYGYYENKTEKASIKNFNLTVSHKLTPNPKTKPLSIESNLIPDSFRRAIHFPSIKINDIKTKANKIAKILDQRQHTTENNNIELMTKQDHPRRINSTYKGEVIKYKTKHSLGRRLNTPVNLTVIQTNENIARYVKQTNITENEVTTLNTETHGTENMKASQPLAYQSEKGNFYGYIATIFITFLVMTPLVFWAVFRLKQKRRMIVEEPEQIEVAHISGRVPW